MPKGRVESYKDQKDLFRGLAEKLREKAISPDINKYKPHEKQLIFHQGPQKGKLFIGGNRSGKTVGGGAESTMRLMKKHKYRPELNQIPGIIRGRIVTTDLVEGLHNIVLPEMARWIPPSELINGSWEDSYDKALRKLTLANGSWVEFMTYEQDTVKFAGTSRHFIWFDEEPPKPIWDECRARLIDTGGEWYITMTPVEGLTWTFETIYEPGISGKLDYLIIPIDMDENPHLDTAEIDVFFQGMSDDDVKARKHGQYIPKGGFVYASILTDDNFIDPVVPPIEGWMHFAGMDHGFTNPTCWLWGAVDKEGRLVIYHEYYASGLLVNQHAKTVLETNKKLNRIPSYYVGDPSIRNTDPITGTSVHLEYVQHGVPIVLGNNDQKAGIQAVSRLLKGIGINQEDGTTKWYPKLFITRDCVNLISELKTLQWEVWRDKKSQHDRNRKEEQKKKNDHAADTLRYMVASRPEFDSGDTIPPPPVFKDASIAESAMGPHYDRELVKTPSEYNDEHMGDYW